jgi:tetratricopeptide (TPR) repeat protein
MHPKKRTYAAVSALLLSAHSLTGAQTHDPNAASPLSLLAAPQDPIGYYEKKVRVKSLRERLERGEKIDWAEAERLLEELTRDYPRDGENWQLLGQVKQVLKKHDEAAAAFRNADSYAILSLVNVYEAINLLAAGNKRAALDSLRELVFERRIPYREILYEVDDFASLKNDPEFLEIAGRPDTTGWSRDYGWKRDIDYLAAEVKRVNPDYHDSPLPAEFVRIQEELKSKVSTLSDEALLVGMNRMLATLRQGHTELRGVKDSRIPARYLPVQFWAFSDGLYIVGAAPEHQRLAGYRLVAIENTPAEEALGQINGLQSIDGDMEYLVGGVMMLRSLHFLKGLGITSSGETTTLTLRSPTGRVEKVKLASARAPVGGLTLPPAPNVQAPLFMSKLDQMHWELPLPRHDALYVQMNNIEPDKDETVPQFGKRLRTELARQNPKNLILDLRHNTGGATQSYPEFLRTVVGFSQLPDKKVYVLIGRNTYSAAGNLTTDLERLADPVFVGEPTSECCNLYGDSSTFTLPYSKIKGEVSAVKWNLSSDAFDRRREMSPEVPVQLTAKDYFAGRDVVMETVFRMIDATKR